MNYTKRFRTELKQLNSEAHDFVDSLATLCYAIGGSKLLNQIDDELQYRLTDGEEFVKVIGEIYERVRALAANKI